MATYRVIDPHGDVVDTKDIDSAEDAHAWFGAAELLSRHKRDRVSQMQANRSVFVEAHRLAGP
jgi:hypothetical protein